MADEKKGHIIFVYDEHMVYPAVMGNIKVELISKELLRRGFKVTWAQMVGPRSQWRRDGFDFVNVGVTGRLAEHDFLNIFSRVWGLLAFCRESRPCGVYLDDWLFLRDNPSTRLFFQFMLRVMGTKTIFDQRDPYLDFAIAVGKVKASSWEQRKLTAIYRLIGRFTDLSIFPSKVYEEDYRNRGLSAAKSLGIVRGIDRTSFQDKGDGERIRDELGIRDKFVVGWFGMMLPNRRIEEVIVPLIEKARDRIPNVHFLIGGKGDLEEKFLRLKDGNPSVDMTYVGFIPYDRLPGYISACDVLLCPLDISERFSQNASPLKILEALSMGRPIIATATKVSARDFAELRGVIWTGMEYDEYLQSLISLNARYDYYRKEAEEQADDFQEFSSDSSVRKIVSKIEEIL